MKKSSRKKLTLSATTLRALSANGAQAANGGLNVSVGTCTGCRPTYNPSEKEIGTCNQFCA